MIPYWGSVLNHESRVISGGLPRRGKTRIVRDYLTVDATRVFFHDVTGHDYTADFRVVVDIDEFVKMKEYHRADYARVVIVAKDPGDADRLKDEALRIRNCLFPLPGRCIVVFEEVGSFERKADKVFNAIFARGGHTGVVPILVSQNASDFPLGARMKASDVWMFGQHHPDELKKVYDCYGDLYAAAVANQKHGEEGIHWREADRDIWWSPGAKSKYRAVNAAKDGKPIKIDESADAIGNE